MSRNCVNIVRPFAEVVSNTDTVQVIGGIGSAALADTKVIILPGEKRVIAPSDLWLPQRRDDGNLRDFDALVLSTEAAYIRAYEAVAQEYIGDALELSFFGLQPAIKLENQRRHPFKAVAKTFLADRYVKTTEDGEVIEAYKALFPFSAKMDLETLETWRLFVGESDRSPAPIPHPGATILNYLTRSVSGLRPKDAKKVSAMARNVTSKAPEIRDWIVDGPGKSQIELAKILNTLGNKGRQLNLVPGLSITRPELDLPNCDEYMLEEGVESWVTHAAVMGGSYAKARALRFAESQEKIVTLWQRAGEKRVQGTIKNQ